MEIKDELLGKHFIQVDELQVILYVEKQRTNQKTQEKYTEKEVVGYFSNVQGALKRIIRDDLSENQDTFTLKQFADEVKQRFDSMNKLFQI